MEAANEARYKPPPGFQEDTRDPLIDLHMSDSTELWLIQWPINHFPDFDGKEVTLKLDQEGDLGSFEGPSGEEKLVSISAQAPEATVFQSSSSGNRIVGKISRRVSLVNYPDPAELEKLISSNKKQVNLRSSTASMMTSSRPLSTPLQSTKCSLKAGSSGAAPSYSGRLSSMSKVGQASKRGQSASLMTSPPPMTPLQSSSRASLKSGGSAVTLSSGGQDSKRRAPDGRSTQDSGRGHSAVTSSGSVEHPKKKFKSKESS